MPISDLPILSMLRTKMQWHQERQRLLAENVANADTPSFRPRDLTPVGGPAPENARFYNEIAAWMRALSARAYELARTGATPIFLGGDHSLSMGSVNGVARHWQEQGRKLFVLWLDAHADFNMPAISPSGNMHGMSSAFLCGETGLDDLLGSEPRASITPE